MTGTADAATVVLVALAFLAGFLVRHVVGDQAGADVAHRHLKVLESYYVEVTAVREALAETVAAVRAAGHVEYLDVSSADGRELLCLACHGPCRYTAVLRPALPWLTRTPAIPGQRRARRGART